MTHTLTPKPEMRQKWGVGVGGRQRMQPHSNVKGEQINDAGPGARFSSPPSTPRVSAPPSGLASNHPHQLKTQLCPLSYADGRQVPTWPPGLIPLPGPRPATHSFLSPSPEPRRPVHLQAAAQQPGARPRPASDQAGPPWHRAPGAPAELKADGSGSGTRAAAHLTARLPPAARPAPRVEFVGPPRPPCRTPASSSRAPVPRALQGSLGSAQGRRTHPGPQQPQPRTPNPRRVMRPGRTIRPARGGGARTARARPDAARRANPPQVQPTREGRVGPAA